MPHNITRILVPLDLSAHSDGVVSYAIAFASRVDAPIEFLNVVEDPFATGAWPAAFDVPAFPNLLEDFREDARHKLAAFQRTATERGVQASVAVEVGRPAPAILEHAERGGFDLIVMGTHGRTGFSHAFLGSVAERVLRKAECPVLTVRLTEAANATGSAAA